MERMTGKDSYCSFTYCDNEGKCKIENVCYDKKLYEKLKGFENLEEQLESIYGECDGLLETSVKSLVKHEGVDFGKPYKARLLTDEDVDKWEEYKDLEEQGRLIKLPCKVGDKVYSVECNKIKEYIVSDFDVCMKGIYAYQGYTFIGEMGFSVFATKEEAEKALEVMGE